MPLPALAVLVPLALPPAEPTGDVRLLRHEVIVDAAPTRVWEMYATEEGMRSWVAPFVEIDLRVGGTIETSYDPDATPGSPENIVQRILAYEPGVMLAARTENAPAFPDGLAGVWGVTRFEPLPGGRTRVVGTMLGWADTEAADRAYAFFDRANPTVYAKLRAHFADDRPDADETMDALRDSIGTWVFEEETARGTFRAIDVVTAGPSERSVVARSWIGFDSLEPHGATLCWLEPGGDVVRFVSCDENAAVTEGVIRLTEDGRTLVWDWPSVRPDGATSRYEVTTTSREGGRRLMTLRAAGSEESRPLEYRRVAELPAPFARLLEGEAAAEEGGR
ncbi:MAG: SRPBCC domain-containing protein [Planctomycetota bacterium JB042]